MSEARGIPNRRRASTFDVAETYNNKAGRKPSTSELKTSSLESLSVITEIGRQRSETWHGEMQSSPKTKQIAFLSAVKEEIDLEKAARQRVLVQEAIRDIIQDTFIEELMDAVFDPTVCNKQCSILCKLIEDRVKAAFTDMTQRVLVSVYIGELRGQGIEMASQCIWDIENDFFTTSSFRNASLFAVSSVFLAL